MFWRQERVMLHALFDAMPLFQEMRGKAEALEIALIAVMTTHPERDVLRTYLQEILPFHLLDNRVTRDKHYQLGYERTVRTLLQNVSRMPEHLTQPPKTPALQPSAPEPPADA